MRNEVGWFFGCGVGWGIDGIELPGVGAVVGHDDATAAGRVEDDFAEVGLFLESGEADDALGQVECAVETDTFDFVPVLGAGEVLFVVIAQDIAKAIVEPGAVHRVQAHNGLTE